MAVENIKVCIRIRPLLQRDFVKEDSEDSRIGSRGTSFSSRDDCKLRSSSAMDKFSPTGNSVAVWRTGHNKIAVQASSRRLSMSFHSGNNENTNSNYQETCFNDGLQVFGPEHNGSHIYKHSGITDVVQSALKGVNGTVLAYGQTGSGKTFTMSSITKRVVRETFGVIRRMPRREFILRVSVLEIYNEHVFDLLGEEDSEGCMPTRRLLEDPDKGPLGVIIESVSEIAVSSVRDLETVLEEAHSKRHISATEANDISSRSHLCVRIVIESKPRSFPKNNRERVRETPSDPLDTIESPSELSEISEDSHHSTVKESVTGKNECTPGEECVSQGRDTTIGSIIDDNTDDDGFLVSCIQLVDLAGSERLALSPSTGQHKQESNYINKSLLGLGNVISRLADMTINSSALVTSESSPKGGDGRSNNLVNDSFRSHQNRLASSGGKYYIPYRSSTLTRLLQGSLGGNSRTVLICTVSPSVKAVDQTRATIEFASRARRVRNNVYQNKMGNRSQIEELKKEISGLRDALAKSEIEQTSTMNMENRVNDGSSQAEDINFEVERAETVRIMKLEAELLLTKEQKKRTEERFRTLREFVLWGPQLGRGENLKRKLVAQREKSQAESTEDPSHPSSLKDNDGPRGHVPLQSRHSWTGVQTTLPSPGDSEFAHEALGETSHYTADDAKSNVSNRLVTSPGFVKELIEKAGINFSEREDLLSQIMSLSAELNVANHEIKTLMLENTKLAAELECYKTADITKDEPQENIESSLYRAEMDELLDKNTELESDLHRLYTKMKALQNENAVLRQDFSSESARCTALEEVVGSLRAELEAKDEEMIRVNTTIAKDSFSPGDGGDTYPPGLRALSSLREPTGAHGPVVPQTPACCRTAETSEEPSQSHDHESECDESDLMSVLSSGDKKKATPNFDAKLSRRNDSSMVAVMDRQLARIISLWRELCIPFKHRALFYGGILGSKSQGLRTVAQALNFELARLEWLRAVMISQGTTSFLIHLRKAAQNLTVEKSELLKLLRQFTKKLSNEEVRLMYESWGIDINTRGKKDTLINSIWNDRASLLMSSLLVRHLYDVTELDQQYLESFYLARNL